MWYLAIAVLWITASNILRAHWKYFFWNIGIDINAKYWFCAKYWFVPVPWLFTYFSKKLISSSDLSIFRVIRSRLDFIKFCCFSIVNTVRFKFINPSWSIPWPLNPKSLILTILGPVYMWQFNKVFTLLDDWDLWSEIWVSNSLNLFPSSENWNPVVKLKNIKAFVTLFVFSVISEQ